MNRVMIWGIFLALFLSNLGPRYKQEKTSWHSTFIPLAQKKLGTNTHNATLNYFKVGHYWQQVHLGLSEVRVNTKTLDWTKIPGKK